MPSLEENKQLWNHEYNWKKKGEEWSDTWGGSSVQWQAFIYPRIKEYLPAQHILEIGCGYGKWTKYLANYCNILYAVDLSANCIAHCREEFENIKHTSKIHFIKNDGLNLDIIESESIDFLFSFDSLVHADKNVMSSYLKQLPRILKKDGVAFIHHSNLGSYPVYKIIEKIPKLPGLMRRLGMGLHWRDTSVSARFIRRTCLKEGLVCIRQEILPWDVKRIYTDCISIITKKDSARLKEFSFYKNSHYKEEIESARANT